MPAWKALEGIFYVLRTGCQWKLLPREYGSGSTVHRRFQEWLAAGFFEKIWSKGLERYNELEGIGWEWQSLDGCMVKASLALKSVGKNPTDRGKMGIKRSVLTDEKGLPLANVIKLVRKDAHQRDGRVQKEQKELSEGKIGNKTGRRGLRLKKEHALNGLTDKGG